MQGQKMGQKMADSFDKRENCCGMIVRKSSPEP
jgi:hypothetical protein